MFKDWHYNIGGKLKSLAMWIAIIESILFIAFGLICTVKVNNEIRQFSEMNFRYLLYCIIGPTVAFISSWILYAFGELVEKTCDNETNTKIIIHLLRENKVLLNTMVENSNSDITLNADAKNAHNLNDKVLVITDYIRIIEDNKFANNCELEVVVLPEGLLEIGEKAFYNCVNLKRIQIPSSVGKIGERSFLGCPKLTIHTPNGSHAQMYANSKRIPVDNFQL